MLSDMGAGWRYLRARGGLLGLVLYFALTNFALNLAGVLTGPLVLATSPASVLGTIQMVAGLGMLIGSIVMSAWGGPRRRVPALIGFITLGSGGLMLAGLNASAWFPAVGLFILLACVPMASAASQAIFQSKVAPDVQGRVFAMRGMLSRSMMPLAFILAGPLADHLAGPLMQANGLLGAGWLGSVLGTGPGRGIGLVFVLAGLLLALASGVALATPQIRRLESDLPDAGPENLAEADNLAAGDSPVMEAEALALPVGAAP